MSTQSQLSALSLRIIAKSSLQTSIGELEYERMECEILSHD